MEILMLDGGFLQTSDNKLVDHVRKAKHVPSRRVRVTSFSQLSLSTCIRTAACTTGNLTGPVSEVTLTLTSLTESAVVW